MDFGEAIRELESGSKIARSGWNGKGMYLVMVVSTYDYASDTNDIFSDIKIPCTKSEYPSCVPTDPYIVMRTANKTAQPGWLPSQSDIFSKDWVIV